MGILLNQKFPNKEDIKSFFKDYWKISIILILTILFFNSNKSSKLIIGGILLIFLGLFEYLQKNGPARNISFYVGWLLILLGVAAFLVRFLFLIGIDLFIIIFYLLIFITFLVFYKKGPKGEFKRLLFLIFFMLLIVVIIFIIKLLIEMVYSKSLFGHPFWFLIIFLVFLAYFVFYGIVSSIIDFINKAWFLKNKVFVSLVLFFLVGWYFYINIVKQSLSNVDFLNRFLISLGGVVGISSIIKNLIRK